MGDDLELDNRELGKRIKNVRDNLELTQPEFGARIGVSRNTLASWETGNRRPELGHLYKIARIGGVTLDWLTGMAHSPVAPGEESAIDDLVLIFDGRRHDLPEPVVRMIKFLIRDNEAARSRRSP